MYHHRDYRVTRGQYIAHRCIRINSYQSRPENVYLTRRMSLVEEEHLSSRPVFSGIRVTWSLVLYVCFVDRCLSFFFWPLCCLFFFDIRILITTLVSSNSSYGHKTFEYEICTFTQKKKHLIRASYSIKTAF